MIQLRTLAFSLCLVLAHSASAATPQSQWSQQMKVGKDQTFLLQKVLPQTGGGVVVFGTVDNNQTFKQDLRILAFQANGSSQWTQSLPAMPEALTLRLTDAVTTRDGSFFILSSVNYSGTGDQTDSLLTRVDAQGRLIWQQKYSGTAELSNYGLALQADATGGVIVVGVDTTAVTEQGIETECTVRHYDRDGHLLWNHEVTGLENCSISSFSPAMLFDPEGNLYLAMENAVIKLGPEGQELWRVAGRAFSLSFYQDTLFVTAPQKTWALDQAGHILWEVAEQGGLYLAASSTGLFAVTTVFADSGSGSRLKLLRFDRQGALLWSQIYAGGEKSFAHGINVNAQGELQVYAEVWTKKGLLRVPQPESSMLSFNAQGQELWHATAKDSTAGASFFVEADGGFYMGDLTGLVTRFSLVDKPVVVCPWYNPWCKK